MNIHHLQYYTSEEYMTYHLAFELGSVPEKEYLPSRFCINRLDRLLQGEAPCCRNSWPGVSIVKLILILYKDTPIMQIHAESVCFSIDP